MEIPDVFPSEYKLCKILWENEPIPSMKLMRLCQDKLHWSKSTTYTVIRRLTTRGVIQNENSICTSQISQLQIQKKTIEKVLELYFEDNLDQMKLVLDCVEHERLPVD